MVASFYLQHRRKAFRGSVNANLIAWYKMDEASGNALDAHGGGYTLTQTGTVGTAAGRVGTARTFNGNIENYLSSTNSIFARGDTDFYFAVWVHPISFSTAGCVFGRFTFTTNNRSYALQFRDSDGFLSWICSSTGAASPTIIKASTAISLNTWNLCEVYHDSVNNQIGIAINNGAFATTTHSGGVFGGTAPFAVGRADIPSVNGIPLNGRVDELALWSRILTTDERALLWNSGNGRTY